MWLLLLSLSVFVNMLRASEVKIFLPANARMLLVKHGEFVSPNQLCGVVRNVKADELASAFLSALNSSNPNKLVCSQKLVSRLVWKWMRNGFPNHAEISNNKCRILYALVLAWLMPSDMKQGRSQANMWNLGTSLAFVNGVNDLRANNSKRHHLRVMLRGVGKSIQKCFLTNDFRCEAWNVYLECVNVSIWEPKSFHKSIHSGTYFMWAFQRKQWYVGKLMWRERLERFHSGFENT